MHMAWIRTATAWAGLGLALTLATGTPAQAQVQQSADFRQRPPEDEVIYFVLPDRFRNGDSANDRGGLAGDRLATGYDPTDRGFYHGGDLKGLIEGLDYIQGLGVTALWIAPIFANKPVQGPPGHESAAYHGYWITDFTRVDPHFGTNDDFRALVEAAHARGIKVYIDIVINHTADVIRYRECPGFTCAYRSRADHADPAYTAYVPAGEADIKVPAWLNDSARYHNRGNSDWYGESALYGDFAGLDDVATEDPVVVQGFIDVYGAWIDDYGIDGYRIDTAKHVNPEFWQAFVPAMMERARARGIPNFHIFGEVYSFDPAQLARHTHVDRLPAVLDFAVQRAIQDMIAGTEGPDRLEAVLAADAVYAGGPATALRLPTFNGNHDMGRIGRLILNARPDIGDDELLARTTLAHALLLTGRGPPVIYYGDEQGFTGDGDDKASRQDMFETRVPDYADDRRIGSADEAFDAEATLYGRIAALARIRAGDERLRRGDSLIRRADQDPGLLAISRVIPGRPGETLVVFNTGSVPITANLVVESGSRDWRGVHGSCPTQASRPGVVTVTVPPLDYMICVAEGAR